MGGNALKKIHTRRYEKNEYFTLFDDIKEKINKLINLKPQIKEKPFSLIKSYKLKETFGDMDILMNKSFFNITSEFKDDLKKIFEYNEIFYNQNVWSFDYKNLQIDLIFVDEKNFAISNLYYSYNDLGNLMGRIANKFGTKYGHEGLTYKLKGDKQIFYEINLSKDPTKIFNFLGFDIEKYNMGFNILEEIFEFVINSKYFNKEIFYYENLNHQNKTRNKKRLTYKIFLDYINNKNIKNQYIFKNKGEYFEYINNFFPEINLIKLRQKIKNDEYEYKIFKTKFNGKIIMDKYPNLSKQKLGDFINFINNSFLSKDELKNEILKLSNEEINKFIKIKYENYKKSN